MIPVLPAFCPPSTTTQAIRLKLACNFPLLNNKLLIRASTAFPMRPSCSKSRNQSVVLGSIRSTIPAHISVHVPMIKCQGGRLTP